MGENLIQTIKEAEEKAAQIIDFAIKESQSEIEKEKSSLLETIENQKNTFNIKKKEYLARTEKEIELYQRESDNNLNREIEDLKKKVLNRKNEAKRFIISALLEKE